MNGYKIDEFIAHIRKQDGKIQTVLEHLQGVAQLSQKFAAKIHLPQTGRIIGLMHDFGKYSSDFQQYIRGVNGLLGSEEQTRAENSKGKIDHATSGAQKIWENFNVNNDKFSLCTAQILASCVASHHTGLSDFIRLNGDTPFLKRIHKSKQETHVDEAEMKCDSAIIQEFNKIFSSSAILEELKPIIRCIEQHEENKLLQQFHIGLLLRFLFSCLIDADRLNTANFERPDSAEFRNTHAMTDWHSLTHTLEVYLATLKSQNHVDELRKNISKDCLDASSRPKGAFSLTVPTGGGKTLASLRFATHHAKHHSSFDPDSPIERIIYVIPYTSIIEQNAETVRNILGDHNVLEHHSNLVSDNDTWRCRILSENWDAPIVFTTSVQFLNALFGSSTRDVRRMHPLANAIIIFDEIQTLPIKTIHLFNNAVNFLTQTCGSSVVFCTATQPLLDQVEKKWGAIRFNSESTIISDQELFPKLRRAEIRDCRKPYGWRSQEVAEFAIQQAKANGSTLIIVNTKNSASDLYNKLQGNEGIKIYHLSTNMCPMHRKAILKTICNELNSITTPIICISTQLIEAGVDIDFGSVIRYLAGLDSIAQAAGRCNRHGHRPLLAPVFVVNPANENINNLRDIKIGQEQSERILDDFHENPQSMDNDLLSPKAISQYYMNFLKDNVNVNEMKYLVGPKGKKNSNLTCDTNLIDLLSINTNSVGEYKRIKKTSPHLFLRQAFETAYSEFNVIDAPTEGVIVPYGEEGRRTIHELVAAFNEPECSITTQKALLRRAQKYSVNVFPDLLKKLDKNGCIYEVHKGSGIYYLDERHYSEAVGITLEETMQMTFLNV